MKLRDLSFFSRVMLLLAGAGLAVAVVSGVLHYFFAARLIEQSVRNEMQTALQASISYFERTYVIPVSSDLRLLESSPIVDAMLVASDIDELIARPETERLFLSVIRANMRLYSSLRLIDARGRERVIVRGERRIRDYRAVLDEPAPDITAERVTTLLSRLRGEQPGTILAEGPFERTPGSLSILVGIAKSEPEIGGFGGAIVARLDMDGFLAHLSAIRILDHSLVWLYEQGGDVLLEPAADPAVFDPAPVLFTQSQAPAGGILIASGTGDRSAMLDLFRVALTMSEQGLSEQVRGAGVITLGVIVTLVLAAFAAAWPLARQFAAPIGALSEMTAHVSAGNLATRVQGDWGGELGRLSHAFNAMVDSLRQSTVSKSYLDNILQSMTDSLVVLNGDGTIQRVNPALLALLCYSEDQLLGRQWELLLAQADDAGRMLDEVARHEGVREVRSTWRTSAGKDLPVSLSGAVLRDRAGEPQGFVFVAQDVTERTRAEQLLAAQRNILERIAAGGALDGIFDALCRTIERLVPGSICSVMMLEDGRLRLVAGPSIPAELRRDLAAVEPVAGFGSCATAAHTGRIECVGDALRDHRWEKVRPLAERYGIHACWSVPIKTSAGGVLGTFAITQTRIAEPDAHHVQVLESAAHVAGIAIEGQRARDAVQESGEKYRTLYDDTPSMFFTVQFDGTIVSANHFGAQQLGYGVEDLVGVDAMSLYLPDDRESARRHLRACFDDPTVVHHWEIRRMRNNGSVLWVRESARVGRDADGTPTVLIVCEDITDARILSEQLSYQASHDTLTGLVNRLEFERRMRVALASARERGRVHALCYLDLDQFKVINDTCGHVAGDELLRQLGTLLAAHVRRHDTLARLGGDEFGLLIEDCTVDDARRVADTARNAIAGFHFTWQGKSFGLGVSIGLVPITAESGGVEALLSAADTACYAAKDRGRNRIHVYREQDEELVRRHGEMQWVSRIQSALEQDRFELAYQVIVPTEPRAEEGAHYELLLRMRDENGQLVPPGAFLPAAERYGLAPKLDRWVIATALRWHSAHAKHIAGLGMCAINLSGHSLGDAEFMQFVTSEILATRLPAHKICFEITETAAITNLASATRFIEVLKLLGCRFALDDFGSGLSSFAYLKTLPVDFLKIDGIFVKDIVDDPIDYAMVKSINEMGKVMGKRTIAEFVENEEILARLRAIGVDYAQGYGIARPQPLETLIDTVGRMDPTDRDRRA